MRRAGLLVIVTLLLFSSCRSASDEFTVVLCRVYDERTDAGYELHLLIHNRRSSSDAILVIRGETIVEGRSAAELAQSLSDEELGRVFGELLGIEIDYTAAVDNKDAYALFTILDSLEAFDLTEENEYVDLYGVRWATLYRNARLLASDQVIDKILVVTGDIPDRKVRDFLQGIGDRDSDEPMLIEYRIDMYNRPLYNGMYGRELIQDTMRRLR